MEVTSTHQHPVHETIATTRGKVQAIDHFAMGEVQESYTKPHEQRTGAILMVTSPEEVDFVLIPKRFSPPEVEAIVGEQVTHRYRNWSYIAGLEHLTTRQFALKVETGKFPGLKYEEEIL